MELPLTSREPLRARSPAQLQRRPASGREEVHRAHAGLSPERSTLRRSRSPPHASSPRPLSAR